MSGLEEAKDRTEATLRDLCLNGPRVDLTMQETVDACLVPNLDWLLTRASTKTFSQGQVCSFVVEWALEHKSYPLLQYLLLNGWDINHPRSRKLCPSWLGCVPYLPSLLCSLLTYIDYHVYSKIATLLAGCLAAGRIRELARFQRELQDVPVKTTER